MPAKFLLCEIIPSDVASLFSKIDLMHSESVHPKVFSVIPAQRIKNSLGAIHRLRSFTFISRLLSRSFTFPNDTVISNILTTVLHSHPSRCWVLRSLRKKVKKKTF